MPKQSFGFSLVELLIAVTIVSVLSAIGATVYRGSNDDAQDQRRLKDLTSIKEALELYRHDQRSYPKQLSDLSAYLNPVPTDPQSNTNRQYSYSASPADCTSVLKSCRAFVVCAKKQGIKSYDVPPGCTNLSCAGTQGDCNMGVRSDEAF